MNRNEIFIEIESISFTKIMEIKNFLISKYKMYEKRYLEIMNKDDKYAMNTEFNTIENIMLFIEDIYTTMWGVDIAKQEICNGIIRG